MKKVMMLICIGISAIAVAQTPGNFVHNPANAGVNNIFFGQRKFLFIYNQNELIGSGVQQGYTIGSIWFRHNVVRTSVLTNLKVTLGHTTRGKNNPQTTFANNFNVGTPSVVLNQASYTYTSNAGQWNVPNNNWTEIPLTTPFIYNGTDNLAIMFEFTNSSSSAVTFYASNGGNPLTVFANSATATTSTGSTARPMLGMSISSVLNAADWTIQAEQSEGQPYVLWEYPYEEEQDAFEIERAFSGNRFELINSVQPQESATYAFSDQVQKSGTYLYRVRLQHSDGSRSYSPVVEVNIEGEDEIAVFPTIIQPGNTLTVTGPFVAGAQVALLDMQRKVCANWTQTSQSEQWKRTLPSVPAGVYTVRLTSDGSSYYTKVMVQP
ncbi:MAG: T9SS type A sorting domain-containing protein [Bacteroidota bacterium]